MPHNKFFLGLFLLSSRKEQRASAFSPSSPRRSQQQQSSQSAGTFLFMVSTEKQNTEAQSLLMSFDPDLANMIAAEDQRQRKGLELIASENFVSEAVREALGSCLTNKYSEGGGKQHW
jgi:hypothetical protein